MSSDQLDKYTGFRAGSRRPSAAPITVLPHVHEVHLARGGRRRAVLACRPGQPLARGRGVPELRRRLHPCRPRFGRARAGARRRAVVAHSLVRQGKKAEVSDGQRPVGGTEPEGIVQAPLGARPALRHPSDGVLRALLGSGKHVPWIFRRSDGNPWGLAGHWNTRTDKATGEMVESYTLLTINADADPLMSRMHRPDPSRPPAMQDKRSVVPVEVEVEDVDAWLFGTTSQAQGLVRLAPVDVFDAQPAAPAKRSRGP